MLVAIVLLQATLAGPTSNSPGGTSAVLFTVEGSDSRTYVGIVNVPALAGAIHSTSTPGVLADGASPDSNVEETAVISTNPLGSPPVQVIVNGALRGIALAVTAA